MAISGYTSRMHDIPNRIADVLLDVEANLRISGKWDQQRPAENLLSSNHPFCVDTLSFEQWLQWIFLPRMKRIIERQEPLPEQSAIYEYAVEYFEHIDISTNELLLQLKNFDQLIAIQSRVTHH